MKKLERELNKRDRAEKARPLGVVAATLVILVAIVGGIWFLTTRGQEDLTAEGDPAAAESQAPTEPIALEPTPVQGDIVPMSREEALPETVTCTYPSDGQDAGVTPPPAENVPATGTVTVTLNTNHGAIPMELDRAVSPCAVNAIVHLAEQDFYDDTVCHRITGGGLNVLQCGDPTGSGAGGPGFSFPDEWPVKDSNLDAQTPLIYPEGSIAMANSGPDTNGSQFFLNYADGQLPPAYTILGKMTPEGLQVVKDIAANGVAPEAGQPDGKPAEEVRIETAEVS
ncbi:peptidylprolyl isomerase [Corynebacterium sp. 335C]